VTRTLIVDDDARFRRHIRQFLGAEPDVELVGEASDGEEAIQKALELKVDLVLMDVRMPRVNGIEATRRLRDQVPGARVIILTMYDLDEYREAAVACGAAGYVAKRAMVEELLPTIRRTLAR
jgi:two-component system response regulator NreC